MINLPFLEANPKGRDSTSVTSYRHQKQVRHQEQRLSTWAGKGGDYQNLLVLQGLSAGSEAKVYGLKFWTCHD